MSSQPAHSATQSGSKSVVIVAGEASGDAHAARLVKHLKQMAPDINFRGMGGNALRAQGVDVFIDMSRLAVMGLVEVMMKYRYIKGELDKLKDNIRQNPPDLLILVDYQEFNQRLAAYAKSIGIKVLFYIGPQVWAWRPNRVYKMARIVDHMAVILPFEKALYEKADVPVTFTGHPLTDEVAADKTPAQARAAIGLEDQLTVGLFPGSRSGEIRRVLPILLETARILKKQLEHEHRPVQFVLPVASSSSEDDFAPFRAHLDALSVHLSHAPFYDVIQSCDVIATASGTAVLEIGLLEVPMVIVYKIAPLSWSILSRMVSIRHVGLVNIIPNREIVREFLQSNAKPAAIADELLRLINDPEYNQTMRTELAKIRQQLGDGNGAENVAKLAYNMLYE